MKQTIILLALFLATSISSIFAGGSTDENRQDSADRTVLLDQAIQTAAENILNNVESGKKIAVLNFNSPSENFSAYVLEELSNHLVNRKKFVVVDRRELDVIRIEEKFQLSGDVSDESAQAIGKKLGAQLVVSGSLTKIGETYRFRTKVLNVESAAIEASSSSNINAKENKVVSLLANTQVPMPQAQIQTVPTSYYVSAKGYDSYEGISEDKPFRTLSHAVDQAAKTDIKKITIIGTLDANSEGKQDEVLTDAVFLLLPLFSTDKPPEILITGKSVASFNERAVLSGSENKNVLEIVSGVFRFEHIEISGGKGEKMYGIDINYHKSVSASHPDGRKTVLPKVIIGTGVVVRNNNYGLGVGHNSICIISGGEIRDSDEIGITLGAKGTLTFQDGIIRNNGVGVLIYSEAAFTMTGGNISSNRTVGVFVITGGRFDQTGGSIITNGNNRQVNVASVL